MPNELATSTSPYLRAHADNPVDWRMWTKDALAEAARRDVPLLISIGYSPCHWCHVMAHEAFDDEALAALLNDRVVPVKRAREDPPTRAGTPVDWRRWPTAALSGAARRDVPLLISIGYSTCHWCHVMAHESFEDEALAALLNDRFVPVKIDREELPDIDSYYMNALQA